MDPDATLANIRALVKRRIDEADTLENDEVYDLSNELAEAVLALDEWLIRGGFLPTAWQKGQA